ncbi:hypothetical protein [Leifsonia sp. Le1]|uniref:hypothetical protein n=1 Tax=Leifsonia sp. Le1 TaxID=3404918 RepID=UPI003EB91020
MLPILTFPMHWGAVPALIAALFSSEAAASWFSAVGTVAAVMVSLYLIRQQNKLRQGEAIARRSGQARRVHMSYPNFHSVEGFPDYQFHGMRAYEAPEGDLRVTWRSTVTNGSDDAISDVWARIGSIDEEAFGYLPEGGDFAAVELVARLLPGQSFDVDLVITQNLRNETGFNSRGDIEVATYLQFVDANGVIWSRDPFGRLHEGTVEIRGPHDPPIRVVGVTTGNHPHFNPDGTPKAGGPHGSA